MPSNALYRTPESVMNALSGPQGPLGMNPNVNRLSLLPRYSAQGGLVAPQWLYDLARAAEAPGNALMGVQTTPEDALNFAGNVALGGIGTSAMMRNPAPGPGKTVAATVYHGSPHNFDKFDMSKIGTGEGAQAYGHGLYVAESPDVAKTYRQVAATQPGFGNFAMSDAARAHLGKLEAQADKAGNRTAAGVYSELTVGDFPPDVLRRKLDASLKAGELSPAEHAQGVAALDTAAKELQKFQGSLYTVDLPDSAIENMLDWDAPLSQQPEAVRKAIAARVADVDPDGMDLGGGKVLRNGSIEGGRRFPDKPYPWVLQAGDSVFGLSEKDVRRMVGESVETLTGEQAYARLSANLGSQTKASEFLRSIGVPGIRYFDGASRTAKDGTRNFVVFDDKLLKILNKE